MAHLVRPTMIRWQDAAGKRVKKGAPGARKIKEKARKWYGQGIPGMPPKKRVPLAANKDVARQMLADLVRKAERGEAGMEDAATEAQRVPLMTGDHAHPGHLEDFEVHLRAREVSAKQIRLTVARIRDTFNGCGFSYPRDLDSHKLEQYLAGLRRRPRWDGGISMQTSNYYLQAVRQLCKWMVRKKRLASDPMLDTAPLNADLDRRHLRRNLEPEQLVTLFNAVQAARDDYRGLFGPDRYWLYHTACGTGLRVSELATLTPESFALDAEPPTATVPAAYSKNKKRATQPLPPGLVAGLRGYLKDRPAGQPVWPGTWHERAAEMLAADLEAVGIPYVVQSPDGPLFADFHALRHIYITLLERSGTAPKAAQALARHSDIRLTMNRYTHADHAALALAVGNLPLPGNETEPGLTGEQLAAALVGALAALAALLGPAPVAPLVAPRVAPNSGTAGDDGGRQGTEEEPRPRKGRRRKS